MQSAPNALQRSATPSFSSALCSAPTRASRVFPREIRVEYVMRDMKRRETRIRIQRQRKSRRARIFKYPLIVEWMATWRMYVKRLLSTSKCAMQVALALQSLQATLSNVDKVAPRRSISSSSLFLLKTTANVKLLLYYHCLHLVLATNQ